MIQSRSKAYKTDYGFWVSFQTTNKRHYNMDNIFYITVQIQLVASIYMAATTDVFESEPINEQEPMEEWPHTATV